MILPFELMAAAAFGAAAYGVTLDRIQARTVAPDELDRTAEQEAADAIIDAIEGKLIDCPLEWAAGTGAVTHRASGLTIAHSGDSMTVSNGPTSFKVEGERQSRLLRACQIRNGKELLAKLTTACEAEA